MATMRRRAGALQLLPLLLLAGAAARTHAASARAASSGILDGSDVACECGGAGQRACSVFWRLQGGVRRAYPSKAVWESWAPHRAPVVLSCDALAALPAGTAMEAQDASAPAAPEAPVPAEEPVSQFPAELFELGPAAPELPPPETLPGTGGSQAPPELPLWPEAAAPPAAPEPAAPAPKQPRQRRQRRSQARKPGGAQPGATPVADGATLAGAGTACAGLWRYDSRRGERRLYRDQAALRAWGAPAPQSVACDVLALLSVGRPMPAAPPARRLAGDCGGDAAVLIPRGDGTFSLLAQAPQVRRSRRTGPPDA